MFNGYHVLTATNPARTVNTADTFKAALFLTTATINADTTAYSTAGEATGTYTPGGVAVTWNTPAVTTGTPAAATAYVNPSADITFNNITLTTAFDCVLIYNASQGNRAVSAHTFTAQTITAGTLTLTIPANTSANALIRFS